MRARRYGESEGAANTGQPQRRRADNGVGSNWLYETPSLTFLLVALLAALAGRVLLLTRLRLPALVLLPRRLLAAPLLLTGLLVGSLRRLRSLFRVIHLSTSLVKIQHDASNDYRLNCKLIKKISMRIVSNRTRLLQYAE
jgi:hypothetical protein